MAVIDLGLVNFRFETPWADVGISPGEWLRSRADTFLGAPELALSGRSMLDGDLRNFPGVYVLFDGEQPMYVGQSANVHNRVYQHKRNKMFRFDGYAALTGIPLLFLEDLEALLISELEPIANGSKPPLCEELAEALGNLGKSCRCGRTV